MDLSGYRDAEIVIDENRSENNNSKDKKEFKQVLISLWYLVWVVFVGLIGFLVILAFIASALFFILPFILITIISFVAIAFAIGLFGKIKK